MHGGKGLFVPRRSHRGVNGQTHARANVHRIYLENDVSLLMPSVGSTSPSSLSTRALDLTARRDLLAGLPPPPVWLQPATAPADLLKPSPIPGGGAGTLRGLPTGPGGAGLLRGLAAGLGAWIGYNIPGWIDRFRNGVRSFTAQETEGRCDTRDWADSYLSNLQRDGIDQGLKSVPPRNFEWDLPTGHSVSVEQAWGKDGLVFAIELRAADGKVVKIGDVAASAQFTKKGGKVRVAEIPWVVAGENFGKFSVDLRLDGKGLNEVELNFTDHRGYVTTWKLKPSPCNLDVTGSRLVRLNQGSQYEARRWVNVHLAESAVAHGGNLYPGLMNLLMYVQPTPDGAYRNHGSEALDVLTRALNALRQAEVDMRPLEELQRRASNLPAGAAELKHLRAQAAGWLQQSLTAAIQDGRIDPIALRNDYEINFGVRSIASAIGPAVPARSPAQAIDPRQRLSDIDQREMRRAVAPTAAVQTRDGRLFLAMTESSEPYFNARLARLAAVLGTTVDQLAVFPAWLTIGGVQRQGVLVEPRRFQ